MPFLPIIKKYSAPLFDFTTLNIKAFSYSDPCKDYYIIVPGFDSLCVPHINHIGANAL